MINDQFEVGHFEPCKSVSGAVTSPGSDTYYRNCSGPYESSAEDPALEPDDSPCYRALTTKVVMIESSLT